MLARQGVFYPVNGYSEIPFNIVPVIERGGGKVLARCMVEEILHDGSKVIGVKVKKTGGGSKTETFDIFASQVISDAGLLTTFQKLLPKDVAAKSYYYHDFVCNEKISNSFSSSSVFLGFKHSNKEMGFKKNTLVIFETNSDQSKAYNDYLALGVDEMMDRDPPSVAITFPSTRNPLSEVTTPGRCTAHLIFFQNEKWFNNWKDLPVMKRGDDYTEVKEALGHRALEIFNRLYPEHKNKIDYIDYSTPGTMEYYLNHTGSCGMSHNYERLRPLNVAKLRAQTDIPGLYLTGQDVFGGGFTGAMFGGFFGAAATLNRGPFGSILLDIVNLHNRLKKKAKAQGSDRCVPVYTKY